MIKATRSILFALLLLCQTISAQTSNSTVNEDGKDFTKLKYAWRAQWITHPTASTLDFGSFLFRRNVELEHVEEEFPIYISADNKYRLYVNGTYVGYGPESGDIDHYRYETRNIAPYLKEGDNLLAIEVINFGEYRKASQQTFQTALICQFDDALGLQAYNTGCEGWKVIKNKGRECIPFVSDSLNGYYAAGPGDILVAKDFPWGWETNSYDDSTWLSPKAATVEFAVGRGFLYGSTWFLVPRGLPYMSADEERFQAIYQDEKPLAESCFAHADNALHVPAHSHIKLLLDNRYHTIGQPIMEFSNGSESSIKITYAESLYDKEGVKQNRNLIKEQEIFGYYDRIYPDGGLHREFQPTAMRTYRFVELEIETKDEPLTIHDFKGVRIAYPFEIAGSFSCNDPLINTIWENSQRTLLNSSVEDFIDPYYEQLQYVGDARIEALSALALSHDKKLMRKAIESFNNSRKPMGLTQSRYPSYITQIIPPYSLIWIMMLHDFMVYDGDKAFLLEQLDGMNAVLNWFEQRVAPNGMLHNLDWWNFTDWAVGYPNGIPHGADDGYSSTVTLQYALALKYAAEVEGYLQNEVRSNELAQASKQISRAVYNNCYSRARGIYAETPEQNIYSQHTNILAILADTENLFDKQQVMQHILNDNDLIQTTIYYKFYLFEAMNRAAMGDYYLNSLDNWRNMVADGLTTFAETDINPRSECHAWSASPLIHLHKIVAGIDVVNPQRGELKIEPHLGELTELTAAVPFRDALIEVSYRKEKKNLLAKINIPVGVKAQFHYNNSVYELKEGDNNLCVKW